MPCSLVLWFTSTKNLNSKAYVTVRTLFFFTKLLKFVFESYIQAIIKWWFINFKRWNPHGSKFKIPFFSIVCGGAHTVFAFFFFSTIQVSCFYQAKNSFLLSSWIHNFFLPNQKLFLTLIQKPCLWERCFFLLFIRFCLTDWRSIR